ncbi:hypothetical protein GWI33_005612 [Rhynchophorus ferrugineus]|uniref:Uncharacterized protein n=1 Tax=Rhynchophorus ferrugineus TaxID=354439 RepID=A0A834IMK7_RHYFE|nr:hypothetical protein GWI33_005612 [Rhynchophorus ferrugineus]
MVKKCHQCSLDPGQSILAYFHGIRKTTRALRDHLMRIRCENAIFDRHEGRRCPGHPTALRGRSVRLIDVWVLAFGRRRRRRVPSSSADGLVRRDKCTGNYTTVYSCFCYGRRRRDGLEVARSPRMGTSGLASDGQK